VRSLTENFARVEAVWVPNIRWHYEVLLWSSWSGLRELLHFTQLVNVVLFWNLMKSCVTLCHHLNQEQYYYWYVVILYSGTFEMAFVQLVLGYLYSLENTSGRDLKFNCSLWSAFAIPLLILVLNGYVWIYIALHKAFMTQVDSLFTPPSHCFHKAMLVQ
jgi:hypothetical protein